MPAFDGDRGTVLVGVGVLRRGHPDVVVIEVSPLLAIASDGRISSEGRGKQIGLLGCEYPVSFSQLLFQLYLV